MSYLKKDSKNLKDFSTLKVAICHYWFLQWRGGEKVVKNLLKIFPQADIYTLFCSTKIKETKLKKHRVYSSFLNFFQKKYQHIFPLYPLGVKSLKLKQKYDLILSSESGPIKGINKGKFNQSTPHFCYIHTPMRYCFGFTQHYLNKNFFLNQLLKFFFNRLRKWDLKTVKNVDFFIANSINVQKRVKKYYNRDSVVVYPPIDTNFFQSLQSQSSPASFQTSTKNLKHSQKQNNVKYQDNEKSIYLSFGAITPYKKIDLLVETFKTMPEKNLVIIGEGAERKKLVQIIQKQNLKNIKCPGKISYEKILPYLKKTKAFLFPGEEDFGMTPLEMMSLGIPVIAYQKGGALETVLSSKNTSRSTGKFFEKQTSKSLQSAIEKFEQVENQFDSSFIIEHAKKFDENIFLQKIKEIFEKSFEI